MLLRHASGLDIDIVRDWNLDQADTWGAVGHFSIASRVGKLLSSAVPRNPPKWSPNSSGIHLLVRRGFSKDGTCVYLIMPTSNTACFQVFLAVLARKFACLDILLVLDGAPNHRCGDLVVPDNVTLSYLPPYSPERNPKEKGSDRDGGEGVFSHGRVFDFGGVAPALGGRGRARTRSTI
jgi:hypothetical protein